jgi:hypothetical protein
MRGGSRKGAGRKAVEINLDELEKLCMLHCTDEEIAAYFGVSVRTIESRKRRTAFAEVMAKGKAKGKISVRRGQFRLLENGNGMMGVWLGKQLLGQRDLYPVELSGSGGKPFQISLEVIDEVLKFARQDGKATSDSGGGTSSEG